MNEKFPLALPEGTVLAGQYIIEKVLGQGGFGITYEAKDYKTGERVAVKEFFPDAMATRTNHTTVSAFSGERGESFAYGKTCFLQEAETLAKFIGNENIVRIHSYFEENETAYFVMDFIEGTSFDEYLKQRGGKIPYEEAAQILVPVMDALSAVHGQGIVHRDVTPDNIYITQEGVVKLLDFGAARYSLGDKSRSLDIILKHGFAPKEQYTRRGKQGPYTDIYALGATFYFALTGKRPPDSVERLDEDDLVPPSSLGVQISEAAEDAILQALSVQPADRFQSMTAFKNALYNSRQPAAVGSQPVSQIYFNAPDQTGIPRSGTIPHSGTMGSPAPGAGQDTDLQNLAATMKTAGKLAGKMAGKMAGRVAEKTAETAGAVAGTAGKMSEIMAAKKAETAEKLAAKMAEREAEKAAREAEKAAQRAAEEAARQAAEQAAAEEAARQAAENTAGEAPESTVGRTVGITPGYTGGMSPDVPPSSTPPKPPMNKKLLLIPAGAVAAIAILVGIFVLKPGTGSKPSADTTPTDRPSASVAPTNPPMMPEITVSPEPVPTATPEPTRAPSADLSVIGSTAGNILNGGIITFDGEIEYVAQDDGASLVGDGKYIFEDYDGTFWDLSFVDGELYFLYNGYAYTHNPQTQTVDEASDITYLNNYFGGDMQRLLLTEDYYVVCAEDYAGDSTVYRVSRDSGEQYECCAVDGPNSFTLSDDGWLYYVTRNDGLSSVYRMRLDTLDGQVQLVYHTHAQYAFFNPIVAGDYLYLGVYDTTDLSAYAVERIDRESGWQENDPFWYICSELEQEAINEDMIGFNVNVENHDIYFWIGVLEDDGYIYPYLYQMKGYEDGTFDIEQLVRDAQKPQIIYLTGGEYMLYYYRYNEDRETYRVYYRTFDAYGTQINN